MSAWGSCDFAEFKQFAEDVGKLSQEITQAEITLLSELADRALRKVQQRTPTGQKPCMDEPRVRKVQGEERLIRYRGKGGQRLFRRQRGRSYKILTRSGAILEKYWDGYSGGRLKNAWAVGNIVRKDGYYEVEVINSEEYASHVEYGHRQRPGRYVPQLGKRLKKSWVKGRFMMTISEQELRAQAPAIIEKRMREFFEGALS